MEYITHDSETGKLIKVYDLEECLAAIRIRNEKNEKRIEHLQKENKELKNECYKDDELQRMRRRLDKMEKDYYRGFPISETEQAAIETWKINHDKKVHGYITDEMRQKAEGCCGGRYTYKFVSTSIGVSGRIICSCGAEFEFQKIE